VRDWAWSPGPLSCMTTRREPPACSVTRALQQIEDALEFGVGVVEVGGEADVLRARSVEPEGGHDSGGFHFGVEFGHVSAGLVEGDDAALVFGRDIGVQDGVAFFFDCRDQPGPFALECRVQRKGKLPCVRRLLVMRWLR